MIKYPESLPLGLISKNHIKNTNINNSVAFDSGISRHRKMFEYATHNTSFSLVLNSEQVIEFERWFKNDINYGQDWFLMKRKTHVGIEELETRFTQMYSGPTKMGLTDLWSIDFNAEIKQDRVAGDWWLFPDFVKYMCAIDCAVNVNFPAVFNDIDKSKDLIDYITNKVWPK